MATFFLIRHGEPATTGVMLGRLDPALSTAGMIQCEALGDLRVEVAWTSPLLRARQTAEFIDAQSVVDVPELREIDQGEWTGKTWAQIESDWGELAARKSADWLAVPAPGGEQWTDFVERVRKAWDVIRAGPTPAAIVAHQGVNAALLSIVDGSDPREFAQAYGEVISFDYD